MTGHNISFTGLDHPMETTNPFRNAWLFQVPGTSTTNFREFSKPGSFINGYQEDLRNRNMCKAPTFLGGSFNPFEKYASQIGSFPQVGVKIQNI